MVRAITASLLCAAALLLLAPRAGAQTVFLPGTPEVDDLLALYQEAGRVFPTTSFPISKTELSTFADRLSRDAPATVRESLAAYREGTLNLQPDRDRVSAYGAAAFEYYYRNAEVSFDPGLPTQLQILDLRRLFLDRLPLGALQLDYARDGGFEIGIAARIEREYFMNPFNTTNLWESDAAAGDPVALENQDIMRGFLWYDFHPLQLTFGRDRISIGPGKDSLLPSTNVPFLDMIRLRLPLARLTGDLVISTLENRASAADVTPAGTDPQLGSSIILMAMHRWEYGFDRVRLGIAGLCVYARDGNAFNLGDVFPVFSWHQADIGANNTVLVADASWSPLPGLLLSGQFGLDDVNLTGAGIGDSGTPTIPAWIVNADYTLRAAKDLKVALSAEAGYTHYLWGNFALDNGYQDYLARAIDRYKMDGGTVLLPLTSPYGPGATWVELSAALLGLPWLNVSLSGGWFSRMTDNGVPVTLTIPYTASSEIESSPRIDTWSVGCAASSLPFGFLKLSVEPTLYIRQGSAWLELALGAQVSGALNGEIRSPAP